MAALLVLAFLALPILEIYVIIQVGQVIGAWPTVTLLVVESLIGAWIVRREGRRAWRELRAAVGSGRLPSRELADGALVLVGGTLLLTPGFVTDAAGFLLVIPPTRALVRHWLLAYAARRATRAATGAFGRPLGQRPGGRAGWPGSGQGSSRGPGPGQRPDGRVVPGEVVQPGEGAQPDDERDR